MKERYLKIKNGQSEPLPDGALNSLVRSPHLLGLTSMDTGVDGTRGGWGGKTGQCKEAVLVPIVSILQTQAQRALGLVFNILAFRRQ